MFSKEESKKIRQEFWTSFGKEYPRKWLLYNTKIKDLSLKFTFTRKSAQVSIDLDASDEIIRHYYYEKLQSLNSILVTEFLPEVVYDKEFELENGKVISRIYVTLEGVNIHNKNQWKEVQSWLAEKMTSLESFFIEYKDFIEE